jgi:signal transduction histidine kinase/ActR/RegA family two-component response regulator
MARIINFKTFLMLLIWLLLIYVSGFNFLLFHTVSELISAVIGFCIVIIAFNSYKISKDSYFTFIAIAYGFAGIFCLTHAFTYKGINLIAQFNPNIPTQLWILSRYMESISILVSFKFLNSKNLQIKPIVIIYAVFSMFTLFMVFNSNILPACFVEGQGVTLFKSASEIIICTIYLLNIFIAFQNRNKFNKKVFSYLITCFVFSFFADAVFIKYTGVSGFPNKIGHVFLIFSSWYLYKAIVETSLKSPFETLFNDVKNQTDSLKRHNERQSLLKDIIISSVDSIELDKSLKKIVTETGKLFEADRCFFLDFDSNDDDKYPPVQNYATYRSSESIKDVSGMVYLKKEIAPFTKYTLEQQQVLIVENLDDFELPLITREFMQGLGVKSFIATPVIYKKKVLGCFVLHYVNSYKIFSDEDINMILSIAYQSAIVINQAKQHAKIKRQAEREALLRKISETITTPSNIEEVQYKILKEICETFDADRAFFRFYDSNGKYLPVCTEYIANPNIESLEGVSFVDGGIDKEVRKIQLQNKPVIMIDGQIFSDDNIVNEAVKKIIDELKVRSIYGIPIFNNEELIGAFVLHWIDKVYLNNDDLELLKIVANQAGMAIVQAKQHFKIQKQAEREKFIREISEATRESFDANDIQSKIVKMVAKAFNADKCFIRPFDENKDVFLPVQEHAEYYSSPELKKEYCFSPEIDEAVKEEYKRRKNFILPDLTVLLERPEPFCSIGKRQMEYYGIMANYCFPIIVNNRFNGAFVLQFKEKTYLELEDIELLKIIVNHAAISLKQAEMFAKTEQASKAKSDFLANMSHEFRTPLNAIMGFTDIILMGNYCELPNKVEQYLQNISKSGKHLLDLVNDVLDISKVEADKLNLNFRKIDLSYLIKEVVTGIESLASRKQINIKLELIDMQIKADSVRFSQIIYNLLSNAIKFTREGGTITVKTVLRNKKLFVSVKDTGIGIAKENYDKIFKHFSQIDSSASRQQEGTGLGLVLTKKLVELHGGSIYFESEPGKGSTFTFELPVETNVSAKNTILIVEDNEMNMELATEILENANFTVIQAKDADEGIEMAISYYPDLILMDLNLPVKNGYEACSEIKLNSTTMHIPILAFTAMVMEEDKEKAFEYGCVDIISKPINIRTFVSTVESYIKNNSSFSSKDLVSGIR